MAAPRHRAGEVDHRRLGAAERLGFEIGAVVEFGIVGDDDRGHYRALPDHHQRLAADQPGQMPQPRRHALAGERRALAVEAQHQPVADHLERRARQHAGLRRRNQIGHPHRGAEHAGAIERAGRGQFADARRQLLVVRHADVAEEHRQREIGAAGMVDAEKAGVRDDVERLLAAIVRMRAPADVGEQAGGVAQPPLLGGLVDAGRSP